MIRIEKYIVGSEKNDAYQALKNTIPFEDKYMHYRLDGNVTDSCEDIFFTAHENGVALSRLWMCYPKHQNAIANWGAFFTLEECRGKGIGSNVLNYCFEEITRLKAPPLGLFCTAGKVWLTEMYRKYGFVTAIHDTSCGPLYRPVGDSPKTFKEFCELYYTPTTALHTAKADFGWRNEIDCLLKFAMLDIGLDYSIAGEADLNMILLNTPDRDARVILTEHDRCVGWMLDGKAVIHPKYEGIPVLF